jgi:hypothetical protein
MLISPASYSLTPHYDEPNKTVNLGTYPVNNITFHNSESKRVGEANAVKIVKETYHSSDHICNQLHISSLSLNIRFVFNTGIYQDVFDHHDGNCHIEHVGTTYFLKCAFLGALSLISYDIDLKDFTNYAYYIATTDSNTEAREKFTITLPNQECMDDIKTHLLSQRKSYVMRSYDPETGKWSSERKQ